MNMFSSSSKTADTLILKEKKLMSDACNPKYRRNTNIRCNVLQKTVTCF